MFCLLLESRSDFNDRYQAYLEAKRLKKEQETAKKSNNFRITAVKHKVWSPVVSKSSQLLFYLMIFVIPNSVIHTAGNFTFINDYTFAQSLSHSYLCIVCLCIVDVVKL